MIAVELVGEIRDIEIVAVGRRIRELKRVRRDYGPGRWRKLKGIATVRLMDLSVVRAEVHWYEAHGIGKREIRVVKVLGPS
jgi:hypothetical protein